MESAAGATVRRQRPATPVAAAAENDTRKLDALQLPTLTLSPQEVTEALAQHVQLRPLRQRLSNLHGQIAPKQKQLAQLRASLVQRQQELTQRNAVLAEKRQRYKDKISNLPM